MEENTKDWKSLRNLEPQNLSTFKKKHSQRFQQLERKELVKVAEIFRC